MRLGHDPVAQFTLGIPVVGDPGLAAQHGGGTLDFANPEHHAQFLAPPQRYKPQSGGYCARGATCGAGSDGLGDP
jgi:hypothetical protein